MARQFRTGVPAVPHAAPPATAPASAPPPHAPADPRTAAGRAQTVALSAARAEIEAKAAQAAHSILRALDEDGLFRALDPGRVLESMGLYEEAAKCAIKATVQLLSRHGLMDAANAVRAALDHVAGDRIRTVPTMPDTDPAGAAGHVHPEDRSESLDLLK